MTPRAPQGRLPRRPPRRSVAETIRALGPAVVLRVAALCDGHSIFEPEAFTAAGLPADVVAHLTTTHRSGGTHKGTLFDAAGQPVVALRGVSGLDALRLLADARGVTYCTCFGRGAQARAIRQALRDHLGGVADHEAT